ncbi:hypothetical protein YC2023_017445 [Brassica napus]
MNPRRVYSLNSMRNLKPMMDSRLIIVFPSGVTSPLPVAAPALAHDVATSLTRFAKPLRTSTSLSSDSLSEVAHGLVVLCSGEAPSPKTRSCSDHHEPITKPSSSPPPWSATRDAGSRATSFPHGSAPSSSRIETSIVCSLALEFRPKLPNKHSNPSDMQMNQEKYAVLLQSQYTNSILQAKTGILGNNYAPVRGRRSTSVNTSLTGLLIRIFKGFDTGDSTRQQYAEIVIFVNSLETNIWSLSDSDFRGRIDALKQRALNMQGDSMDSLLPLLSSILQAFIVVREAFTRVLDSDLSLSN